MKFSRDFMLVIGPISSAFDFLTFYVMLLVLKANETLFQTGWFVESLCPQVQMIFVIRTRGKPFKSWPHHILPATSLAVVAIAARLPFAPVGTYFGFVPPPAQFCLILAGMVIIYLILVELAKREFYRWHPSSGSTRRKPVGASRSVVQQELQDDAGGNRHQYIVATGLHPVIATWRCAQVVAAPIVDHILPVTVFGRQALTPAKIVVRSGATLLLARIVVGTILVIAAIMLGTLLATSLPLLIAISATIVALAIALAKGKATGRHRNYHDG
jgi:hypothetical protein